MINDRHGHSVGDEIITKIGALLGRSVRDTDLVARLGGDEFGIVLLEADRAHAELVAEKIIDAVRSRGLVVGSLIRAQLTASIGITLLDGSGQLTAEELLVEADRAMYQAKAKGRNRYAVHEREPRRSRSSSPSAARGWSVCAARSTTTCSSSTRSRSSGSAATASPGTSCCCACATTTAS